MGTPVEELAERLKELKGFAAPPFFFFLNPLFAIIKVRKKQCGLMRDLGNT
jgi:hypothetical protein